MITIPHRDSGRRARGARWGAMTAAAATLLALGVAGCASGNTSSSSAAPLPTGAALQKELHSQKMTINIGGWPTPASGEATYKLWEGYKAQFEKEYPNITITTTPLSWGATDAGQTWYTALAAGNIPTASTIVFTEPPRMISSGYSANIKPELDALGWTPYLNKAYLQLVTRGNAIYGLPNYGYYQGLFLNPVLFKKAGLWQNGAPIVPTTWQQLAEEAQVVHSKTGAIGFELDVNGTTGGWLWQNIARDYGCNFEQVQGGKTTATFDTQGCVAALQFLKDLRFKYNVLEPDYTQPGLPVLQNYAVNRVAMTILFSDLVGNIQSQYKSNPGIFSIFPLPGGPSGAYTQDGGSILSFSPKASPLQIVAAIEFEALANSFDPLGGSELKASAEQLVKSTQAAVPSFIFGIQGTGDVQTSAYAPDAPALTTLKDVIQPTYDPALFQAYLNEPNDRNSPNVLIPEPPTCTQDLYSTLTNAVMQPALQSASSNPAALLKSAVSEFQSAHLDTGHC